MNLSVEARIIADKAETKYGPFRSTHEAYGVLAEEVAELLDAIRSNSVVAIRNEALDVSAVALRLAEACESAHQRPDGKPAGEFERRSF